MPAVFAVLDTAIEPTPETPAARLFHKVSAMHHVKALFAVALLVSWVPVAARADEEPAVGAHSAASAAESAIRANVEAFVKAYNERDAKGVADLFAPAAQIIDEEGNTTQGRKEIQDVFTRIFADAPGNRIEVNIGSIRMIGTALAIETGTTKVVRKSGEVAEASRYTVVHVKTRSGHWLMALARDIGGAEMSNFEHLKALEWMVGDWADESRESLVLTRCRWSQNKNFLLQEIKIRARGRDAMNVTQRIGWDPLTKRIKAWMFNSEGGYAESFWVRDGDHWLVKATGVRRDGVTSSATNTITPTGRDSYTWRSSDRIVGNEVMPPVEVKVVRQPPAAAESQ